MPLPKPGKGQDQKAFMKTCMGNPTMLEEFPDPRQRAAVCMSQFRRKKEEPVLKQARDALKK